MGVPTVLLLHGAFADASIWRGVIPALQDNGLDVIAPANPLRGLASDAAYVADVVREIDGPVLLVGHGYGGAVITAAGERLSNAVGLIYVAAFAPDAGESALDLLGRFPGSLLLPALRPATVSDVCGTPAVELYVRVDDFSRILAGDLPPRTTTALATAQRPIVAAALAEGAGGVVWKTLPSSYVIAKDDRVIPPAAQLFTARRAGARMIEIDASHAVPLSCPVAVAAMIRSTATD
jgi:pimeloyl-ACP methyl ester carboxylesterase